MKYAILLIFLASISWAALPDVITDPSTRDTVEYLDAKIQNVATAVISSATYPTAGYTVAQATAIDCVTGSTISITTSQSSKFLVSYAGTNYNSVAAYTYSGFKINGAVGGGDAIIDHSATSGSSRQNMSFSYLTEAYPAGTYSFCLWLASDSGTMGFVHTPRFSVISIR